MADTPTPTSQPPPQTILLHIVSPNSEIPGRLVFTDVPISETIAHLKRRIQDAVPSKPALERQRIIYRGRALIQHELTLQSILGSEASTTTDPFTFHLVLSPAETNSSSTATLRPDGLHQPLGLPNIPTNNPAVRGLNIPPRPASTSQVPEGAHHQQPNLQNFPQMPYNPLLGMLPQGLQPGQGVDIRMQVMQTGRPFHSPQIPPGMMLAPGTLPGQPGGPMGNPLNLPHNQQPHVAEQQVQDLHQQMHQMFVNRAFQQHHNHAGMTNQNQHPHFAGGYTNANVPIQPSLAPTQMTGGATEPLEHPLSTPSVQQFRPSTPPVEGSTSASRQQPTLRQLPNGGGVPSLGPMAAANLHALRQNHLQNMQIDSLAQMTQLRNALTNPSLIPRSGVPSPFPSTVYLLASPHGPEAILLSDAGTFTTPPQPITSHHSILNPTSPIHLNNSIRPMSPEPSTVPPALQAQQVQAPPQQQQPPQQQEQDQIGDLLRILLPLGGHLWLLVRLIGFVYLFSGGRGWWNTVVLGLLALIGFLAQTGVFNPLIRDVWRPVRQHVEGIINFERPRPPPVADGQEPTPQQMADRLMERQANDNVLRRAVRRMERSTILFAASLIPGVGESQIRAREAAERAQREAEEAAERARLEAEQQEQAQAQAQAQNEETAEAGEKGDELVSEQAEIQEPTQVLSHGEVD